jgi:hypothetical protein
MPFTGTADEGKRGKPAGAGLETSKRESDSINTGEHNI